MRIGIVTVSYAPRRGGAAIQSDIFYDEFTRLGHHAEIFCPDTEKSGPFIENGRTVNRVHNRWIKTYHDNLSRAGIIWGLRQAIQQRRADFDTWISPEFNVGPLSMSLAWGIRRAACYGADLTFEFLNQQGNEFIEYDRLLQAGPGNLGLSNWLKKRFLYLLQDWIVARMERIIVLNDPDRQRLDPSGRKSDKIHCPVRPPVSRSAKPRDSIQKIAVVGRNVSWKCIGESIASAIELKITAPRACEVVYLGSGQEMTTIKNQWGQQIRVERDRNNEEVRAELRSSDVVINLSKYETYCIVNIEALLERCLLITRWLPAYQDYLRPDENCLCSAGVLSSEAARDIHRRWPGLAGTIAAGEASARAISNPGKRVAEILASLEKTGAPKGPPRK